MQDADVMIHVHVGCSVRWKFPHLLPTQRGLRIPSGRSRTLPPRPTIFWIYFPSSPRVVGGDGAASAWRLPLGLCNKRLDPGNIKIRPMSDGFVCNCIRRGKSPVFHCVITYIRIEQTTLIVCLRFDRTQSRWANFSGGELLFLGLAAVHDICISHAASHPDCPNSYILPVTWPSRAYLLGLGLACHVHIRFYNSQGENYIYPTLCGNITSRARIWLTFSFLNRNSSSHRANLWPECLLLLLMYEFMYRWRRGAAV